MSPILLLTGLLGLAYFGTMLVERRSTRGFGLPSGTEFLLLGLLIGPHFMGLITSAGLASFGGLTVVALAWLAFIIGAHYGWVRGVRVPFRSMLLGIALAALAALFAGVAAVAVAALSADLSGRELLLLGLGVGAVSAETTRHAVRWVVERYAAEGPLTRLLGEAGEADDAVPIMILAAIAALMPTDTGLALSFPGWAGLLSTVGIGAAMGATCAALFDVEPRTTQRWGIVVGTGLLSIGASMRLGLSGIATTFVMGIAAASLSRQRAALEALLTTTERAVMLPALLLAGAHVWLPERAVFLPIVLVAVIARLLAKLIAARAFRRTLGRGVVASRWLGFGLLPAGVLSVTAGFACALMIEGLVGQIILAVAATHAVLGEIIGPASLRRALRAAGEIRGAAAETPRPLPAPVTAARKLVTRAARLRRGLPVDDRTEPET